MTPANVIPLHDRVPPNDEAAEAAVLSAVLLSAETIDKIRFLAPRHFYQDANRKIFEAYISLQNEGKPIDILTVRSYLDDRKLLPRIGGSRYLAEILDAVPSISNVEQYANSIVAKSRLRDVIAVAKRISAEGYSAVDVDSFIDDATKQFASIEVGRHCPIETLSTDQVFEPQPPVPWVCREIYLAPGRPSLVAGYGYSAKSVSCQALLLAVASGADVWGRYQTNRGTVLHLDHEQGKRATVLRYQRLARAMGVLPEHIGDRLRVAALPKDFRLSNHDSEDILEQACQGVAVCLLDSLRATTPGIDENDSQIRDQLDKLLRVSEKTGTAFIVIHHAGKGGKDKDARERGRGSSAIFDACGLVLQLDGKVQDDGSTIVNVTMTKAPADASGAALPPFALKVSDVMDEAATQERWGLGCVVVDLTEDPVDNGFVVLKSRVYNCIKFNPGVAGTSAIRARLGCRKADVVQAVAELVTEEQIENRGTTSRPKYYTNRSVPNVHDK